MINDGLPENSICRKCIYRIHRTFTVDGEDGDFIEHVCSILEDDIAFEKTIIKCNKFSRAKINLLGG